MPELVSVIIPVYNCAKYISDLLENLVNQTYRNLEIILIDDGSKDNSADICKTWEKKHSNIHYFYQENGGAAKARNNGLDHANGAYIMFVDGDDQVKSTIVEELMNNIDENVDIVCCSYEILGTGKHELMFPSSIIATSIKEKEPFYLQLMDYTYGHDPECATAIGVPWGKIFRRELIEKNSIRFDTSLRRMQDNIFIMEAFYHARKVVYLPLFLYVYRLDHIKTYSSVSYAPEVYKGVLNRRDSFYSLHTNMRSPVIDDYLYKEHLNYLMMSVHYLVANGKGDKKDIIKKIKDICEDKIYSSSLCRRPTRSCSRKQQLQWCLYKLKMYSTLYYSYKIKYKL